MFYSKELRIQMLENRIANLEASPKDNNRIVIKLKRRLKNLLGDVPASTGC